MEAERLWSMRAFDPSIVSLEQISDSLPYFTKNDPVLYTLFLEHNKGKLNEDEIDEIKKVIETLSNYHLGLMEMNKNYMERDLDGKPHESLDDERNPRKERDERDETDDFVQR